MEINPQYYYLLATMVSVLAAVGLFVLLPRERASMLWSGGLLVPFALIDAPLATSYWGPGRIANPSVGIEDILWTFAFGTLAWAFAAGVAGPLPRLKPLSRGFAARALALGCFGGAVRLGTHAVGLAYAGSAIASHIAVAALVFGLRTRWRRLILGTSFVLTAYYVIAIGLVVAVLGKGFALMWSREGILGPLVFGIPIEEFIWVASFGAAWVPVLLFASDPRRSRSEAPA